MGFPLTEAFWVNVRVRGAKTWVLVQPFERRVLSYTPDNDPTFAVEMGNIGTHYWLWRYQTAPDEGGTPVARASGTANGTANGTVRTTPDASGTPTVTASATPEATPEATTPPGVPTFRDMRYGLVTDTTASLSFATDIPATSHIVYGTASHAYQWSLDISMEETQDHFVTITGLAPKTRYYFAFRASGPTGSSDSRESYFATAPLGEVIAAQVSGTQDGDSPEPGTPTTPTPTVPPGTTATPRPATAIRTPQPLPTSTPTPTPDATTPPGTTATPRPATATATSRPAMLAGKSTPVPTPTPTARIPTHRQDSHPPPHRDRDRDRDPPTGRQGHDPPHCYRDAHAQATARRAPGADRDSRTHAYPDAPPADRDPDPHTADPDPHTADRDSHPRTAYRHTYPASAYRDADTDANTDAAPTDTHAPAAHCHRDARTRAVRAGARDTDERAAFWHRN